MNSSFLHGRGSRSSSSDLSDIPPPPLLDDLLPSQCFNDDLESFSASQALQISPRKGLGIMKSRVNVQQSRPRVRFVPPVQHTEPSHSQEDLFSSSFGSQELLPSQQSQRKQPSLGHHQGRFINSGMDTYGSQEVVGSQVSQRRQDSHYSTQFDTQFPIDHPGRQFHALDNVCPAAINLPDNRSSGGSARGTRCLRSIEEIPDQYRSIFPFPYFNFVQSQVLDDILYTNKPMVVCAPTGSGKTAMFELAILRLLISQGGYDNKTKVVYMAPIKALCSQRCEEWKDKFEPLGLKCQELTGDTDIEDFYQLQAVNIIFTTPEKWDSMTRRWRDNHSLVQLVKLFLIDEVHSLNEETRGATVEAVISRMKTVQAAQPDQDVSSISAKELPECGLRFFAVSATITNIEDIAQWLGSGTQSAVYHKFDDSQRPVQLRKVVLGYPCSENFSDFRFDLSLNYKLSGVVQTYSDNKPTLVFCATRKATEQAAAILVKEARFILNAAFRQRVQLYNNRIRDSKLRDLVMNGVGYHHAGLDLQDRKAVEEMFLQGDLPVLMATSTLAMGVNLPAHLVVVKSTQYYASGVYTEFSETQVLQMIGRAGRPQFDTSATAVIMTKQKTKGRYESLLNGTQEIESSLHNHLLEHLNAEIVLRTISSMEVALGWLKSTFLYIRMQRNPTHYGLPKGLDQAQLEKRLRDMCMKDLKSLADATLIEMDTTSGVLKPQETGRLMARYCVAYETMKQVITLGGEESLQDVMILLSKCKEFADIQLRINERKVLNKMNKDKHHVTIRYPMSGKIKTNDMKVNCLIQATLGSIPIQEFALNQDCYKIFRTCQRLTKCLSEYLMTGTQFKSLLSATIASKCVHAKLWENSGHVARQLDKIGPTMSNALFNAGLTTFHKLEEKNPRELELIVNRHPPFGNQIVEAVAHLPKYDVSIEQVPRYSPVRAELTLTVSLLNHERLAEKQTTRPNHMSILLLGDADNRVVYKQRITDSQLLQSGIWMRKVEVKRAVKGEDLSVNLISQDYVGLDVQSVYTPFYSGPKHLRATCDTPMPVGLAEGQNKPPIKRRLVPAVAGTASKKARTPGCSMGDTRMILDTEEFDGYGEYRPCSHRCSNKNACGHECCKFGIPVKAPLKPKASQPGRSGFLTPGQTPGQKVRGPEGVNGGSGVESGGTPGKQRAPRGIDGFLDQLHQRAQTFSGTPNIKRLKFSDSAPATLPKLDKFAYTPSRSLLPSMQKAAWANPLSSTHEAPPTSSLAPPTSCKPPPIGSAALPNQQAAHHSVESSGWEHLDFYRQQRERELSDFDLQQYEEEGCDLDDELPKVSLGLGEEADDLPCFNLGESLLYETDDCRDESAKSPPNMQGRAQPQDRLSKSYGSSGQCDSRPSSASHPSDHLSTSYMGSGHHDSTPSLASSGYLWCGLPMRAPRPPLDQSVPSLDFSTASQHQRDITLSSSIHHSQPTLERSSTASHTREQCLPLPPPPDPAQCSMPKLSAPSSAHQLGTSTLPKTSNPGPKDPWSMGRQSTRELVIPLPPPGHALCSTSKPSSPSPFHQAGTAALPKTSNLGPKDPWSMGRQSTREQGIPLPPPGHALCRTPKPSSPSPFHQPGTAALPKTSNLGPGAPWSMGRQSGLPLPQLSGAWNKPLGRMLPDTVQSGVSCQPSQHSQPMYGSTVMTRGPRQPALSTDPGGAPKTSSASPDEQSLITCLDSVERDFLQRKQGPIARHIPRISANTFFGTKSPRAEDDIPEFSSIFQDLF